jgi:starch synthase
LKVLAVAPECYPLIKTGGLADVVGALPGAVAPLGCDMRVLLPLYPAVTENVGKCKAIHAYDDLFGGQAMIIASETHGLNVFLLEALHLFDRPGNPYLGPDGKEWPDNHLRFAALSRVACDFGLGLVADWKPDVVHAHDWQAGLASAYLALSGAARPKTVTTIHNLAFQGLFPSRHLAALGLPAEAFAPDGLEYFGQIGFLKAGLVYSDAVTTVSPTYAMEIRTPALGMGLDGLLNARAEPVIGILNGIDLDIWNPAEDEAIETAYSARSLKKKAKNKIVLQQRFGLEERKDALLACVISRLTDQKGIDLIFEALPDFIEKGGQLALLGSGDAALEKLATASAAAFPGQVGAIIGYDEALSHRVQAGADMILIPSRFEPCGLTQLIGLRYGTLPLVARTGGLADTVIDANEAAVRAGAATGFQFAPTTAEALHFALERALQLYRQPDAWKAMQKHAMAQDVGWAASARRYMTLYESLCGS